MISLFILFSSHWRRKYSISRGKSRAAKNSLNIAVREIVSIMLFPWGIYDHKLSNCNSNTPKLSAYVCILRMNALFKKFHAQKVAFWLRSSNMLLLGVLHCHRVLGSSSCSWCWQLKECIAMDGHKCCFQYSLFKTAQRIFF